MIDGATNKVVATCPVGDRPGGVGVNPATGPVYVANGGDGTVSVLAEVAAGGSHNLEELR